MSSKYLEEGWDQGHVFVIPDIDINELSPRYNFKGNTFIIIIQPLLFSLEKT